MKKCIFCKGNNPYKNCGRITCPILTKLEQQRKVNLKAKQNYFGEAPNIFIGHHNYPNVNVGFLSVEEYRENDEPLLWSRNAKIGVSEIISLRTELINSNFKSHIKGFSNKFIENIKEISLSSRPVDVEVSLNKKPHFLLTFNQEVMPHGPSVKLSSLKLVDNPKIDVRVEKVTNDDILSTEAVFELYKKGFDEYFLTKVLSAGNLGLKKNRKLVPTRWSITAVDDIIGKRLIKEIEYYNEIEPTAFFGGYLGNYYIILMFPAQWAYDLYEGYLPDTLWNPEKKLEWAHDFEDFRGRKNYAFETGGGYYAARVSVLEKLKECKKKAGVLCIRFITKEYWAPLGVWVVREAVRHALKGKGINFSDNNLMLEYAKKIALKKFNYDISEILKNSQLVREMKQQKKLLHF